MEKLSGIQYLTDYSFIHKGERFLYVVSEMKELVKKVSHQRKTKRNVGNLAS